MRPERVLEHTSPAWRMEKVFDSGKYECAVTRGDFHEDLDRAGDVILPLQHSTAMPGDVGELSSCSHFPFPFPRESRQER